MEFSNFSVAFSSFYSSRETHCRPPSVVTCSINFHSFLTLSFSTYSTCSTTKKSFSLILLLFRLYSYASNSCQEKNTHTLAATCWGARERERQETEISHREQRKLIHCETTRRVYHRNGTRNFPHFSEKTATHIVSIIKYSSCSVSPSIIHLWILFNNLKLKDVLNA